MKDRRQPHKIIKALDAVQSLPTEIIILEMLLDSM
jgi:hypothetical protein